MNVLFNQHQILLAFYFLMIMNYTRIYLIFHSYVCFNKDFFAETLFWLFLKLLYLLEVGAKSFRIYGQSCFKALLLVLNTITLYETLRKETRPKVY